MIKAFIEGKSAEMSDAHLWESLKKGREDAFEHIYHVHVQNLYEYGMHIEADSDMVKDAIQELFIHIWQRRAHLGAVLNVQSYLMVSLRNRILEIVRTRKKKSHQLLQWLRPGAEVDDSYESHQILQETLKKQETALANAIEKLPSKHREIIYLLYYKNLSQVQVAKVMSITLPSVYTLTWKATKRLRKYLRSSEASFLFPSILALSLALLVI